MNRLHNRFRVLTAALLASACLASPAFAEDAATLAAKFGARESIRSISVSPDGTKIAVVVPGAGTTEVLAVVDLAGDAKLKPILNAGRENEDLTFCRWSTDAAIVCNTDYSVDGEFGRVTYTRLFSLRPDGSDIKILSKETNSNSLYSMQYGGGIIDWTVAGKPGQVLMTRQFVPEVQIGSHMGSEKEGLGVEAVDVQTLKRVRIESPRANASEYIADGQGTVRVMSFVPSDDDGYTRGIENYVFRRSGSREWEKLGQVSFDSQTRVGFAPVAVDSAKNVVYGFDNAGGFEGLYSIALDGTGKKTLVLKRDGVDVDSLIRIGRSRRVVGASYASDKRETEFFDPELKVLRSALGGALPQHPIVDFIDSSADERKLLIIAASDTDPGMLYLYDKDTRKLEELLPARPELRGIVMGKKKPISFPAADGTMIPAYLTLPPGSDGRNLPTIVMPHGGPSARSEWGFDWLPEFFAVRGFAVLEPNFRGSSGYGSAWFEKNGFQSWKTAIGDVNDAGRWLQKQGIAEPGKLAIVGWSYGGYAALQTSVLDSNLFKAIVAIAPVTDLTLYREEFRQRSSYKLVSAFVGQGPHLREGSPLQNPDAISAPVLLFHGDRDDNVGIGESRMMADKLREAGKDVQLVEFKGLDHQLDDSQARARMLVLSDEFLRKALGL